MIIKYDAFESIRWYKSGKLDPREKIIKSDKGELSIGDKVIIINLNMAYYSTFREIFKNSTKIVGSELGEIREIAIIGGHGCAKLSSGNYYKLDCLAKKIDEAIRWYKSGKLDPREKLQPKIELESELAVGDSVRLLYLNYAFYSNSKEEFIDSKYDISEYMGKIESIKIINGIECARLKGGGYYKLKCLYKGSPHWDRLGH